MDDCGCKLLISWKSRLLVVNGDTVVTGFDDVAVAVSGSPIADVGATVVGTVGPFFHAGTISNNPSSLSSTKTPFFGLI